MIKAIHPIAGGTALLTILIFWLSTVLSELFVSASVAWATTDGSPSSKVTHSARSGSTASPWRAAITCLPDTGA